MMKEKILVITCIMVSLCFANQAVAEDVNFALGKPASVSSLWDSRNLASTAVDGIYPAAYPNLVHTASGDYDPWWKVDLESNYEITFVELWNRQECCQDRLRNIIVEVLDEDGTTVNYGSEIINPDNVLESPMSITYTLDTPTVGKYIQVRRIPDEVIGDESTYILCVSEVRVFGNTLTAWNPDPADGAIPVAPSASLSWSQPTAYTPTSYDIAYGTNSSLSGATVVTGLTETTYDPAEDFGFNVIYYWRVDSYDGATKYEGEIWSFTSDGKVGDPDPADGAARVGQDAPLMWRAVEVPSVTYDVYFQNVDANEPLAFVGNVSTNSYNHPAALDSDNTYAWRIDAVCSDVNTVEGDLWSYTTGGFVTDPIPADSNSVFTATEITLSWTGDREGDTYIDAYDVYFGSDPVVEVTTPSYEIPYELTDETTYTWRVDTKHDDTVVTTGTAWEFTTGKIVGHWPFDNNLNDVVGDNDAERAGAPAFTDGIIDQAIDFGGDLGDKPAYVTTTTVGATASWAISVWDYSYGEGAYGVWETILGNGSDTSGWGTFEFGRLDGNRYVLGFNQVGGYYVYTPNDSSYPREGWHLHVISYNSATRQVHWYIDAVRVATLSGLGITLDPELYIGNVSGKSQPFDGKVDDLKFYSKPLGPNQVISAYVDGTGGAPMFPVPASGTTDISWDPVLEWIASDSATSHTIEIGTEPDLSDATPIALAAEVRSFDVFANLGIHLTPSTAYYWRVTSTIDGEPVAGPIWYFVVRDLIGDLSGDLVVDDTDVVQMAGKWLEDTSDYPPEIWNYMDQENWGYDPNVLDYFIPWSGDGTTWAVGHIELETSPTPSDVNDFTPSGQTVLWSYDDSEGGWAHGITIFLLERIDFSKWDKFGYWVYQRECTGSADIRIDSANGDGIYRDWYNMVDFNNQWHKYEWDIPAGAATDVYQIRFYRGQADSITSIEELSYFYLSKDDTTVKLCLPWNLTNSEDLTLDCKINLDDLVVMALDWMLDASND